MSERLHWRDAEEAARWLASRDGECTLLLFLAQLPFASARLLAQLVPCKQQLGLMRERGRGQERRQPRHAARRSAWPRQYGYGQPGEGD